ncbi:MAG: OsmC family protein [Proteobacteria bacterium]|nr:OsmC family protein [Pseudomonadota bacterium]
MSEYSAIISWNRQQGEKFTDNKYSRAHQWSFDGGLNVAASSSPHIVPAPYSVVAYVDPEEAFIASISSCHMLFFLSIAAKNKFTVESYLDHAKGVMAKDETGNMAMTVVTLKPAVVFFMDHSVKPEQLETMHHQAHKLCFIANSVKTKVVIETI